MHYPILPWQSWPQFVAENPWAADALEMMRFVHTLLNQWGDVAILLGLGIVWYRLRKERLRLEERVETLGQHAKAATEASEASIGAAKEAADRILSAISSWQVVSRQTVNGAARSSVIVPPVPESSGDTANWVRVSDIWRNLKERIELRIEAIPRANVRAKYSRMKRRTYENIISALRKDNALSPTLANKLRDLDTKFHAVKFRPTSISEEEVDAFREGEQLANRELPELPEQEGNDDRPTA